jgi:prefoldin beta subunit
MGGHRGAGAAGGPGMKEISPQLQNQIAQYQQLQNQLQVIGSQRVQLEAKLREIEQTLEELNKLAGDTPVYKSIGMLLVRQDDREALKKELEEHKETLTIRVKSLQKQEKALSERYEDLASKIQTALGTAPATQQGG